MTNYPGALTALWLGVLNNDSEIETTGSSEDQKTYRIVGDPTEGSLLVAATKAGAAHLDIDKAYPRENEVPFDSERKRMITIHNVSEPDPNDLSPFRGYKMKDWDVIAMKGAPDVVLDLCSDYQTMDDHSRPLDQATRQRILAANDTLTKDALRVLGLAYRVEEDVSDNPDNIKAEELERDLIFVGLVGMIDPAREEVKPALEKAREAGIRTVMITGDFPNTARAIAETIHLLRPGKNVMTGAQLDETSDTVSLVRDSFVPRQDQARMFGFLGNNVGDHMAAAVANILSASPPHVEQAVFADELSAESLAVVHRLVAKEWKSVLTALVPQLEALIDADAKAGRRADRRVRIGMYEYHARMSTNEPEEH